MLCFDDALAMNTPAIGSRSAVQKTFMQIHGTFGGAGGPREQFMAAVEAAAVKELGLPAGTTVEWGGCCAKAKACVLDAIGTINWAALWAAIEPYLALLIPILIPLL